MVRLLKQQRSARRKLINLEKQPGDGLNLMKDPLFPNRDINLRKEPPVIDKRNRRIPTPIWQEEVQEGLVPIGGGFLRTPAAEPVDPRDCNKWKNSIWCDGLSWFSPGSWFGGDIGIIKDDCNIGINYDPSFLMISGPSFQVVWRKPECRIPEEEPLPDIPELEPDSPYRPATRDDPQVAGKCFTVTSTKFIKITDTYPITLETVANSLDGFYINQYGYLTVRITETRNWVTSDGLTGNITKSRMFLFQRNINHPSFNGIGRIFYDVNSAPDPEPDRTEVVTLYDRVTTSTYGEMGRFCFHAPPSPYHPPPPPFPFGDKPPMACSCPSPRQQRAMLEKLNEIDRKLGDAEFDVPQTLISTESNPNPGNVKIDNLSDFQGYVFERLDEVFGQWEIPIEIEDIEPFTEGKQTETIRIPNLAEAIADIWGAVTMIKLELGVTHHTAFRTLATTGQNFQMVWQNQKKIDAITNFLGFKTLEKIEKIPLLYNPFDETGEPSIYLENTEIEAVFVEFDLEDKRNLQTDLLSLLHSAAVIRAAFWRPLDKKNPKGSLMSDIFSLILNRNNLNQNTQEEIEEFEKWLESYREGFPNWNRQTNGSFVEDFWGTDYENRPTIQDITDKINKKEGDS